MFLFNALIVYFILEESLLIIDSISNCVFGPKAFILSRRQQFHIGPKRSPKYNPNYAYEPYWPGGDWVFERFDTTTEKKIGLACGVQCSELYEEFGEVCGRSLNYTHKTFSNYCALLDEDCTGREKWLIAYRGKCQDQLKIYPTKHDEMVTRAQKYLDEFEANNPPAKRYKG